MTREDLGDTGSQQRTFTSVARDSGERLVSIVNDLFDFSRIEGTGLRLDKSPTDIAECVESATALHAQAAAAKGLELQTWVDPDLPIIYSDATRHRGDPSDPRARSRSAPLHHRGHGRRLGGQPLRLPELRDERLRQQALPGERPSAHADGLRGSTRRPEELPETPGEHRGDDGRMALVGEHLRVDAQGWIGA